MWEIRYGMVRRGGTDGRSHLAVGAVEEAGEEGHGGEPEDGDRERVADGAVPRGLEVAEGAGAVAAARGVVEPLDAHVGKGVGEGEEPLAQRELGHERRGGSAGGEVRLPPVEGDEDDLEEDGDDHDARRRAIPDEGADQGVLGACDEGRGESADVGEGRRAPVDGAGRDDTREGRRAPIDTRQAAPRGL